MPGAGRLGTLVPRAVQWGTLKTRAGRGENCHELGVSPGLRGPICKIRELDGPLAKSPLSLAAPRWCGHVAAATEKGLDPNAHPTTPNFRNHSMQRYTQDVRHTPPFSSVVLRRGSFAPLGAFGNSWGHFGCHSVGVGRCYWHLTGRGPDAAQQPAMPRTPRRRPGSGPQRQLCGAEKP